MPMNLEDVPSIDYLVLRKAIHSIFTLTTQIEELRVVLTQRDEQIVKLERALANLEGIREMTDE